MQLRQLEHRGWEAPVGAQLRLRPDCQGDGGDLAARRDGLLPRRALALSQGTADQLYLAVRLAVCDLVLPGEDPCPLVLDDALANFDDARMALALETLAELGKQRQILLFTCHSRERAWQQGR